MSLSRTAIMRELRTLTGPLWSKGVVMPAIIIEGYTAAACHIVRTREQPGIILTHLDGRTFIGNVAATANVIIERRKS